MRPSTSHDWVRLPEHLGLRVTRGPLPGTLPGAVRPFPGVQVAEQAVLIRFRDDGRLLVRGGRDVTIEWDEAFDLDGDPSWILQGWAVTLAWLQRGHLSLHAATVLIGDTVVAVAGRRGAGKSTTTMGLRSRGHGVLVDDVALVEASDGRAWTTPYARNVHLLPDAAAAHGLDFDALPKLAGGRDKAAFRVEDPAPHRRPLHLVVVLDTQEGQGPADDPVLERLRGARCLQVLAPHTARDGIAPAVLGPVRYFELLTQLANAVPVYSLRRPSGAWSLPDVVALIETAVRDVEGWTPTRV